MQSHSQCEVLAGATQPGAYVPEDGGTDSGQLCL